MALPFAIIKSNLLVSSTLLINSKTNGLNSSFFLSLLCFVTFKFSYQYLLHRKISACSRKWRFRPSMSICFAGMLIPGFPLAIAVSKTLSKSELYVAEFRSYSMLCPANSSKNMIIIMIIRSIKVLV